MNPPRSGIVPVDKRSGYSSSAAVAKVRRALGTRSAGHTGTLDPLATGLLVVCFGRATRVTEYLGADEKRYTAVLRLGVETDTGDVTGNVIRTSDRRVTRKELLAALPAFTGRIRQVPPLYSAIWVNGRRLYEIARSGETAEVPAREVEIRSLAVTAENAAAGEFTLDVVCSKGTYIRSLCRDLGLALGSCGTMAALRRTAAGRFSVDGALTPDEIAARAAAGDYRFVLPLDSVFSDLPRLETDERGERYVRDGATVPPRRLRGAPEAGRFRLYRDGAFLAVGTLDETGFHTEKNFYEL